MIGSDAPFVGEIPNASSEKKKKRGLYVTFTATMVEVLLNVLRCQMTY